MTTLRRTLFRLHPGFILVSLVAFALGTVIAFFVMMALFNHASHSPTIDTIVLQQANILRGASNELLRLADQFYEYYPQDGSPPPPGLPLNISDFRADVRRLQQVLAAEMAPSRPLLSGLDQALARLAFLCGKPEDRAQQQVVNEAVRASVIDAEAWIESKDAGRFLQEPRYLPRHLPGTK